MFRRCFVALAAILAAPAWGADSVFVERAFDGTWGASFPIIGPQIIGPISFSQIDDADGPGRMDEVGGAGSAASMCPPASERREFYEGTYDYGARGATVACTNGTTLAGVYRDFDGSDFGTILITETNPGPTPTWAGTFTNSSGDTGDMRGVYQGGGIATPLARLNGNGGEPPSISTGTSLPNGTVGIAYSANLTAEGGTPPYTWELIGDLPANLSFTASNAGIGGTPSFPGSFRFVAAVTDSEGETVAKSFQLQIDQAPAAPAMLSAHPNRLLNAFSQGALPAVQGVSLPNEGGGSLPFQVDFSTQSGGGWLSVSPLAGETTGAVPENLEVMMDPGGLSAGTYFGEIQIHVTIPGGEDTTVVPVAMAVSSRQQTLDVSHRGLRFTAVAGAAAPPPQRFRVSNSGLGIMPWDLDARTLSGGNWLGISPSSGTSEPSDPATVEVRVDPQGLASGAYYGLLEVASSDAGGSPKLVTVVLNLLPGGDDPGPLVDPLGMIFVARSGEDPPPAQELRITNLTNSPLSFTSQETALDGVQATGEETEGVVAPGQTTVLNVEAAADDLPTGIYRRLVTLLFDGGIRRNVDVVTVVPPQGAALKPPAAVSQQGCAPTEVSPVFRVLGGTSPIPAGWPSSMEVEVVDDCGIAVQAGSVVADFAGITSPSVALNHTENGVWAATWNVPEVVAQSMAAVTVTATDAGGVSGSLTQMVNVVPNPMPAPRVSPGGVVHGASFVQDPLGPGTIVSIFGQNLSSQPLTGGESTPGLPLPTDLAGTQISLGGRPVPILFSRTDQVNAVLPFEVTDRLNESLPLLVRRTDAQSVAVSEPVFVTLARPGLFAQNAAGTGRGSVQDVNFQTITDDNPVSPGDAVIIYATGLGDVTPGVATGTAAPASPLAQTAEETTVTIGGRPAQVVFAGLTPFFASLYQVNCVVPQGVGTGDVEVLVTIGGQTSPPVTLVVQ